jgi:hypothetical protein
MSGNATTRELFQLEIRTALDAAEQSLRAEYGDPAINLAIVDHRMILQAVAPWAEILDWEYAQDRATAIHRSCFIGISTGPSSNIAALALVRVSKHRVTTSLLFLQKDEQAELPGRAMAMMDLILEAVAAVFESTTIAIDTPLSHLVPYYKSYGYVTEIRLDRRLLLTKPA